MSKYTTAERNKIYKDILPMVKEDEFVCNAVRQLLGVDLDAKGDWFKEHLPELYSFNRPDQHGNFYLNPIPIPRLETRILIQELTIRCCIEMTKQILGEKINSLEKQVVLSQNIEIELLQTSVSALKLEVEKLRKEKNNILEQFELYAEIVSTSNHPNNLFNENNHQW